MRNITENIGLWKANKDIHECDGHKEHYQFSRGVIYGLELARESIIKPCNTQMHVDKEPCRFCKILIGGMKHHNFCWNCGRALSQ